MVLAGWAENSHLDDIMINSNDWQQHLEYLRAVLRSLKVTGLTANLKKKYATGRVELWYLGFCSGHKASVSPI